jgi:hypothetical protein
MGGEPSDAAMVGNPPLAALTVLKGLCGSWSQSAGSARDSVIDDPTICTA